MSLAHKYIPHYTVADYQQWEGDWELWEGIPVAMTPSPFGRHQAVAARLIQLLRNQLDAVGSKCEVLHEIDWVISDDTVVRPDVMLLVSGIPERHVTEAPLLIAEVVSPSTAEKDRGAKFQLYQQQGVGWYLILDPENNVCDAYHHTPAGTFARWNLSQPLTVALPENREIALDMPSVFP